MARKATAKKKTRTARASGGRDIVAQTHRRMMDVLGDDSFAEIGRRTGAHPENIRRYVDRLSTPPMEFLARVAQNYGCSLDWMVLGKGARGRR